MNAHTLRISSQGSHRIPFKNDIGRELVRTYTCPSVNMIALNCRQLDH